MEYTTTFSEVKEYWGFQPRNIFRSLALDALSLTNSFFYNSKVLKTPRIQFLYFHHVFEDEAQNFERFVEILAEHHTFISHTEAVQRVLNGAIDKAYISWSSDDGFKNNLKAAEILNDFDAKAIFYLNPVSIGIKSIGQAKEFCAQRLYMPPIEFMDWNDVDSLLKQGHEIGSHSMEHRNMGTMNPEEVEHDLLESKRILTGRCGDISHFAYPFGRYTDFTKTAFDLVFKAGYQSCASAKRGCHYTHQRKTMPEELLIRRDQINANWPLTHLKYVVSRGARGIVSKTNTLPSEWFS